MSRRAPYLIPGLIPGGLLLAALALPAVPAPAAAQSQTRTFERTFPLAANGPVRLANLAGRVELVPSTGSGVTVSATVHAQGRDGKETADLLSSVNWVESSDSQGRFEWAISYPVRKYAAFHYPHGGDGHHEGETGFLGWMIRFAENLGAGSGSHYLGERVRVTQSRGSDAPSLWVDLQIGLPSTGEVAFRQVVGDVSGGQLRGDLSIDTGRGAVRLAGFDGDLVVDTGSGEVELGPVNGVTLVDTGSGSIEIASLTGRGTLDTGSGDITVERVDAEDLGMDTGSGSIKVGSGWAKTVRADTGSGEIELRGADFERFHADTGSGSVLIDSPLERAREVAVDTGSGSVEIRAGANASFDLMAEQGSGDLDVGFGDANLIREGREVVGARRGDGRTEIRVSTGSGDCSIEPR